MPQPKGRVTKGYLLGPERTHFPTFAVLIDDHEVWLEGYPAGYFFTDHPDHRVEVSDTEVTCLECKQSTPRDERAA